MSAVAYPPGMIRSAHLVVAALLLAAPAFAQGEIREEQLVGEWCAGPGGAAFQELSLSEQGGVRRFESWLHQRPDESGSWELAGRVLTLRGPKETLTYEVRTVARDRLVLRAQDTTTEVYLRGGCPDDALPADEGAATAGDATVLLGEWRGRSLCTDRERAPACKDEEVIYLFTRAAGSAQEPRGRVHLKADKIVAGEIVPMGEMDFDWSAGERAWISEVETARFHGRWRISASGDRLSGTLVELPSGAQLRAVQAERVGP